NIYGGPLTNTSNVPLTVSYPVYAVQGSCGGAAFTLVITVDPKPQVNAMSTIICSGVGFVVSPVNGTNGLVPANTRYEWGLPSGTNLTGGAGATNQTTINGTLTNGVNVQRTATYVVTPSFGACSGLTQSGTPFTVTVFVDPTPSVTGITLAPLCTGSLFAVTPTAGIIPSNTVYGWGAPAQVGVGSVTGGVASSFSSTNVFGGPLYNNTNASYTLRYTVTPQAGNCVGGNFLVDVQIDPRPSVPALSTTICAGAFVVTPTPTTDGYNGMVPVGTAYNWNLPASTSSLTVSGPTNATTNITGTLTNNTSVQQTAVYSITPSFGACSGLTQSGNPFTLTVSVNPRPSITTINRTICTGTSFVVTPTNGTDGFVPDGTTYTWGSPVHQNGSVTGGQSNLSTPSGNIYGGPLTNTSNAPLTVSYPVTPRQGGCNGTPFTLVITVDPKPQVNEMSTVVCSGLQFIVSPSNVTNGLVPVGTLYAWGLPSGTNLSGGAGATNQTTINGTLTNGVNVQRTATYVVTPSFGACSGLTQSGTPFTVTVFVDPTPSVTNITLAPLCTGSLFAVTPTAGIIPSNTLYGWGVPAQVGVGSVTGGAASAFSSTNVFGGPLNNNTNARYTLRYTVTPQAGNCVGSNFLVDVQIDPRPSVPALSTTICNGVFFVTPSPTTNGINGQVPVNTVYNWSVPPTMSTASMTSSGPNNATTTITGTLTNNTSVQQTAVYVVTPSFGACSGLTQSGNPFTVTVFVNPAPAITTINRTICSGTSFVVTPTNGTDGFVPDGTTYTWLAPIHATGSVSGGVANAITSTNIYGGPLTNTSNVPLTVSYPVYAVQGSCGGAAFTLVITVDPKPQVNA
ncbi:MAG: PKD-like domain-containing protein, partial [Pseudomonadota bacterium]